MFYFVIFFCLILSIKVALFLSVIWPHSLWYGLTVCDRPHSLWYSFTVCDMASQFVIWFHSLWYGFTVCDMASQFMIWLHSLWYGFTVSDMASLLLILLLKKIGSTRLRESDVHPISPKTPAPQYQPIDRKKRNWKRVEDYSRDRAV